MRSELKPLRSGKVKDLYELDRESLLMVFSDRISAYDVMLADEVEPKGIVMCLLSKFCFERCEKHGLRTHMLGMRDERSMVVMKLEIIPVEVIVRNYIYGSYWNRISDGKLMLPEGAQPVLASKLPEPIVEFTTKFEAKDRLITEHEILMNQWASRREIDEMSAVSLYVNDAIQWDAQSGGLILADFKLEFGRSEDGVILADEAETPDVCRLWDAKDYRPGRVQKSFDKQLVRDFLAQELGWPERGPPPGSKLKESILPKEIVQETSRRYTQAYERLTGTKFRDRSA